MVCYEAQEQDPPLPALLTLILTPLNKNLFEHSDFTLSVFIVVAKSSRDNTGNFMRIAGSKKLEHFKM